MSRLEMEQQLLELRYPRYTAEVDELIERVWRENKPCADTSDVVIDAIWAAFSEDFGAINIKASGACDDNKLARKGVLTADGREALRTYIDQAREYAATLADMEDDPFETLYQDSMREHEAEKRARRDEVLTMTGGHFSTDHQRQRTLLIGGLRRRGPRRKLSHSRSASANHGRVSFRE